MTHTLAVTSLVGVLVACDRSSEPRGPRKVDIAFLRSMPEGFVDYLLPDAYVTYAYAQGYYVQQDPSEPGIRVFLNDKPTVTAGNRVTLHVHRVVSYMGSKQIEGARILANDHAKHDVSRFINDLSAGSGRLPAEDVEGELVRVKGVKVVGRRERQWLAEYGSGPARALLFADSRHGAQSALRLVELPGPEDRQPLALITRGAALAGRPAVSCPG